MKTNHFLFKLCLCGEEAYEERRNLKKEQNPPKRVKTRVKISKKCGNKQKVRNKLKSAITIENALILCVKVKSVSIKKFRNIKNSDLFKLRLCENVEFSQSKKITSEIK